MKFGSNTTTGAYVGANKVLRMMQGSDMVYSSINPITPSNALISMRLLPGATIDITLDATGIDGAGNVYLQGDDGAGSITSGTDTVTISGYGQPDTDIPISIVVAGTIADITVTFNTHVATDVSINPWEIVDLTSMFENDIVIKSFTGNTFKRQLKMSNMFKGATNLEYFDFNISNSTYPILYTNYMFSGCSNLRHVDIGYVVGFASSNWEYMFENCSELKQIIPGEFYYVYDNCAGMFSGCSKLQCIAHLDIQNVSASKAATLFTGCDSMTSPSATSRATLSAGNIIWSDATCSDTNSPLIKFEAVSEGTWAHASNIRRVTSDGLSVYSTDNNNRSIYYTPLSTPFDLSTAGTTTEYAFPSAEIDNQGYGIISVSHDGAEIYRAKESVLQSLRFNGLDPSSGLASKVEYNTGASSNYYPSNFIAAKRGTGKQLYYMKYVFGTYSMFNTTTDTFYNTNISVPKVKSNIHADGVIGGDFSDNGDLLITTDNTDVGIKSIVIYSLPRWFDVSSNPMGFSSYFIPKKLDDTRFYPGAVSTILGTSPVLGETLILASSGTAYVIYKLTYPRNEAEFECDSTADNKTYVDTTAVDEYYYRGLLVYTGGTVGTAVYPGDGFKYTAGTQCPNLTSGILSIKREIA